MLDPHSVLGIQQNAEPEVIDAAYRALMKKYHPDHSGPDGLEKAKAITLAYAALKGRTPERPFGAPDTGSGLRPTPMPDAGPSNGHIDYLPTPPLRMGVRLGFAMLALFGIPLLGAAILKLAGG
ncbi:J domain-containing protein [Sphingomonas sp. Leaf67]|uniref:J domain-containing protein n=1 Tax=Sphingomonas sp. Leaf67 TaxID=1736230 RepID=UPI00138F3B8D|nr:J domain-containing protein [Sphingomonas sp. Leaf67]